MGGPIGLRGGQAAPGYADSILAHCIGIAPKYDGVPIQPAKERSLVGWKMVFFMNLIIPKDINRYTNTYRCMPKRVVMISGDQAEALSLPENQDINFSGLCRKALDEELQRRNKKVEG
jgi:hypothetical protein